MSRKDRRTVTRASILLELVNRQALTDREKAAALLYERDKENAEKAGNPGTSDYDPPIRNPNRQLGVEISASIRLEQIKGALPPSIRAMLGDIERCNTTRRGSLAGLPIKSGQTDENRHALVCVGALKTMLGCLADAYMVPREEAVTNRDQVAA